MPLADLSQQTRKGSTLSPDSGVPFRAAGPRSAFEPSRPNPRGIRNGFRMNDQTQEQDQMEEPMLPPRYAQSDSNEQDTEDNKKETSPAIASRRVFAEREKEELRRRDERDEMAESLILAGNTAMTAVDGATLGGGFLLTGILHFFTLVRWNTQMIWGDVITQGKDKYIGGLRYRGVLKPLDMVDPHAVGFVLFVITMDILFIFLCLIMVLVIALVIQFITNPFEFLTSIFGGTVFPT